MSAILDQYGKPMAAPVRISAGQLARLQNEVKRLKAKYDAAADGDAFLNHWANVDHLSPDAANSYTVRRKLRSRSRYEVIENNPYLKGTILTIVNDFVGSGPKLQVTDKRLRKEARRFIERSYSRWCKLTRYRKKLWRLRMAKSIDGEGFKLAFNRPRLRHPVKLDFQVLEADRISSLGIFSGGISTAVDNNEIDGVRFDNVGDPTHYHVLDEHPGGFLPSLKGKWIRARFVSHWFRQDRGWLRGIPETTASLPLCALLRRYTLAVVKAAEVGADFAAVLESEGPPNANVWTDGSGTQTVDNPFDMFPIEQGMFTTLPWGYKLSQLRAEQPIQTYDSFVKSLLMEIARPLLAPFNLASGSSKDSNMASAVVDTHIYKEAQRLERIDAEEEVLNPDLELWWGEFVRSPEVRESPELRSALMENPSLLSEPPDHMYRWDRIGLDHTDPAKVANALKTSHDKGFLTDRDIQETYYNRDVDDWREDYEEQVEWRKGIEPAAPVDEGGEEAAGDATIEDPETGEEREGDRT